MNFDSITFLVELKLASVYYKISSERDHELVNKTVGLYLPPVHLPRLLLRLPGPPSERVNHCLRLRRSLQRTME